MNDNYKENNKKECSYIKIIINESHIFQKDKITLPYNLSLQFDDFPEKKIKSINNIIQKLEPPSNEYIFEINPKQNEFKEEELLEHILIINAYTTTIFFIQKIIASIKIPIFLNNSQSKQWYILKDNNDEACIKLLIEININISNNLYLYNKANQYICQNNNNYIENSINGIAVRKKKSELINNNNKFNMMNNNVNHNNNNSNCYTHLSTNFHSIYSNSLIKVNCHSTNNSNVILANNKSTPIIFNNNNCNNCNNNNNYSNISYILIDKDKDKSIESNTIYNNDNFFSELEIPLEDKDEKNNLTLDEQLINIKNMINIKEKKIEEKEKNINMKKNELISLEKKYYVKNKKYERDLMDYNHNLRQLEKDKQKYENQHFDLNDRLLCEKFNNYKNQLIYDINDYEKQILNGINNMTLINYNNDNLLLESKMNNLLYKNNNKNVEKEINKEKININYKINNKLYMNLDKYILNTINIKEKEKGNNKNLTSNSNNSNININTNNNKNTSSDLSLTNRIKKYAKNNNKKIIKKNTTIKTDYKSKNKNKNKNKTFDINNGKNNTNENNKNIQSEKTNEYSSSRIRIINNNKNNILNNNNKNLKNNNDSKYKLNTTKNHNNLSCLNKNSIFNSSLPKKMISSNNLLNLQKNNSLITLGCTKTDSISTNHYSNTYKAKNKKIKKYPIKLKLLNVANYENFDVNVNMIISTEPSTNNNGYDRKSFKKPKEKKNSSINCYNSHIRINNLYTNATTVKNEKKRKIFGEKIINKKQNKNKLKMKSISADKENNHSNNMGIGINTKYSKEIQNKNSDDIKYSNNETIYINRLKNKASNKNNKKYDK